MGTIAGKVTVSHPFHPLAGRDIHAICRQVHWGEDQILYLGEDGRLRNICAAWTDIDPADDFRRSADGRAALRRDPKKEALARDGALNPRPEAIRDPLFVGNPFFDPDDLLQVRYEMVRRHRVDRVGVSEVAESYGVSRPTFYKSQSALDAGGLSALLPHQRGPKGGHKISADVLAFAAGFKVDHPEATTAQCLDAIGVRFGVKAHRRSLERALARKKKDHDPA